MIFTQSVIEVSAAHTLKMHFLLHWPGELLKWGRECNMNTNVCEACHKTTLKAAGKKTNQHSDMLQQVLERSEERTLVKTACLASDLHHDTEDWEDDIAASR